MENEGIVGIYSHLKSSGAYYFLYLFNQNGMLDKEILRKIYDQDFLEGHFEGTPFLGPFQGLEALHQYAFRVCEEFNGKRISLFTSQDYDTLVDNFNDTEGLYEALLSKGNVLENPEQNGQGLLGRFFKR